METNNNRPFFKDGLNTDRISFSGGRLALDIARHGGITKINYYGNQRFSDVGFFQADMVSTWSLLFRTMVCFEGTRKYVLEFNNTTIYPNGYSSHCSYEGVDFQHEMILKNEEMVFKLKILSDITDKDISFQLVNTDICTRIDKTNRTWEQLQSEFPLFRITDHYPDEIMEKEKNAGYLTLAQNGDEYIAQPQTSVTCFGITGGGEINWHETPRIFRKHYTSQKVSGDESFFILGFGHKGEKELCDRLAMHKKQTAQSFTFPKVSSPEVISDNQVIDSFMMNAGNILDSMKVKDIPGGMRAADSGYWIWGWDSIVYADSLGYLNQNEYITEMLDFYRQTADAKKGIFHEMTINGKPYLSMAYPAQSLYAVMLYWHYVFSGDKNILDEYLPFTEELVRRAGEKEVSESGLIQGVALYPDHPEDLEQDGNDLSVFNNSIYYQALRVLEILCSETGRTEDAAKYKAMAKKTCTAFAKFYDPEKHFFYDSLSSVDFSPRKHYPVYAILHVTPFALDLLEGKEEHVAKFMQQELSSIQGCRMLPLTDSRYNYDGNQLGMYMPVTERLYREMQNHLYPEKAVAKFYKDVAWNWERITIPEALTCEYENHGITPDNPGRKQSFTVKSWVVGFYSLAVGIHMSTKGIHIAPSAMDQLSVNGLKIRNCSVTVINKGSGAVKALYLNGKELINKDLIEFSMLKGDCKIIVERALSDTNE